MPYSYINAKNQTYYLHVSHVNRANPRYYFSMKTQGHLLEAIPNGFEVYENPNGRVFLRKKQPRLITQKEESIVEVGLQKYSNIRDHKLVVKKKTIIVYTADQDRDELREIMKSLNPVMFDEKMLNQLVNYSPILQFELVDPKERKFITRRYCFIGSIDDWIEIGQEDILTKLVHKYIGHLGKDSYYELE